MNDIPEEAKADRGRVRSGCEGVNPDVGRRIVGIDISRVKDCSTTTWSFGAVVLPKPEYDPFCTNSH